jgi:signal transduction histidine kinase
MASKLQEVEELKRQFFHDLTHDLRQPLGSVQGYVELLLSGKAGPLPEEQREHLMQVQKGAEILRNFVDDIMDLAKFDSAQKELHKRPTDLKSLAQSVVDLQRVKADELGVAFENRMPERLPPVPADEIELRRVLSNLVANALKFTPAGGKVTLDARPNHKSMLVSVSDSGCGIPPDKLTQVFVKFYKVPETLSRLRAPAGVGLGLAICQGIVEAHGGRIWAESDLGFGSKFCFTIPLAEPMP